MAIWHSDTYTYKQTITRYIYIMVRSLHLTIMVIYRVWYYNNPYFEDGQSEVYRGEIVCLQNLGLSSCWSKKLGVKFCFIYSYFLNLLMGGKGLRTVYCHLPIPIPYILYINLILSMSLVLKPHLHCPLVSPLPLYLVNLIFWHL